MMLSMTWASVSCFWPSILARQHLRKPCEQRLHICCMLRLVANYSMCSIFCMPHILCMLHHQTGLEGENKIINSTAV